MTNQFIAAVALLAAVGHPLAMDADSAVAAARRADASVHWQPASLLKGDFTCRGATEFALLGTTEQEIVVAVLPRALTPAIEIIKLPKGERTPETAVLAVESLAISLATLKRDVGMVPDGLTPSATCKGLNMSDQRIDAVHLYWHRQKRRFMAWSL